MGMSAAAVVARLSILVDVQSKDAAGGMGRISKGLDKLTGPALAAGAAVAGIAAKAAGSASRLQQSMGAVDSVFGTSAGQIHAWADAADQSVGLAAAQYGELASVLGAQLKNMGVPMDQIAGKTNDLIKMGADLSATYGGTTAEAVEALGSALRGETDPIERYGISIKQATIEAAIGKDKLKGMTDAQQKAAKTTALLGLVTKQAGGAVGAFGREADTAAGQQQRASAAWEDASAALGMALLPVITAVAQQLAGMAAWVQRNSTLVLVLGGVVATLAAAIVILNAAVKAYTLYTKIAGIVSKAAWRSALGPIGLVIAAIVAVVAVVIYCYKRFGWFRDFVNAVWAKVRQGCLLAFNAVRAVVSFVVKAITAYVRVWGLVVTTVFRAALAVARSVWNAIRAVVAAVVTAVTGYVRMIGTVVGTVLDWIRRTWTTVWGRVAGPVKTAMDAAMKPIHAVTDAIDGIVSAVKRVIEWVGKLKFPSPPKWLSKLPGVGSLAAPAAGVAAGVSPVRALGVPRVAVTGAGGGGPTFVIQGALDPAAVAAQIRRILREDSRRRGVVVAGGSGLDRLLGGAPA